MGRAIKLFGSFMCNEMVWYQCIWNGMGGNIDLCCSCSWYSCDFRPYNKCVKKD